MKVIKFPRNHLVIDSNGIVTTHLRSETERVEDHEARMERIKEALRKINDLMESIKHAQERSRSDN